MHFFSSSSLTESLPPAWSDASGAYGSLPHGGSSCSLQSYSWPTSEQELCEQEPWPCHDIPSLDGRPQDLGEVVDPPRPRSPAPGGPGLLSPGHDSALRSAANFNLGHQRSGADTSVERHYLSTTGNGKPPREHYWKWKLKEQKHQHGTQSSAAADKCTSGSCGGTPTTASGGTPLTVLSHSTSPYNRARSEDHDMSPAMTSSQGPRPLSMDMGTTPEPPYCMRPKFVPPFSLPGPRIALGDSTPTVGAAEHMRNDFGMAEVGMGNQWANVGGGLRPEAGEDRCGEDVSFCGGEKLQASQETDSLFLGRSRRSFKEAGEEGDPASSQAHEEQLELPAGFMRGGGLPVKQKERWRSAQIPLPPFYDPATSQWVTRAAPMKEGAPVDSEGVVPGRRSKRKSPEDEDALEDPYPFAFPSLDLRRAVRFAPKTGLHLRREEIRPHAEGVAQSSADEPGASRGTSSQDDDHGNEVRNYSGHLSSIV